MPLEADVAAHYARPNIEADVVAALKAAGRPVDRIDPDDLAAVDEFHLGWRPATEAFATALAFPPSAHVLDIGCGIGGPARYFARHANVRVTGIDLTPDFVEAAEALTRRCGLSDRAEFQTASALALPYADASFGGAYTIHVAMNIADKTTLFREARRVLKPGATFGVYDIMRLAPGDLAYPMPWAARVETSFVATPEAYRAMLADAGFAVVSERDRRAFALEIRQKRREAADRGERPPALGALNGPGFAAASANIQGALDAGILGPVEIIAHAV